MSIPDYETIMLPLLRLANANPNEDLSIRKAGDFLANEFRLDESDRAELLPSGGTFKFSSRVSWAATFLKKAGLLEAPRQGKLRITSRGIAALKTKPKRIDSNFLSQYEEFREFRGKRRSKKDVGACNAEEPETPTESMDFQYRRLRETLATEILEKVKKCSPLFFERLVINLLVKMGYGGSLKDAGQAIGRSGDGGVDGVIKEDKLGLDNIYIQAKKWTDRNVGSPDIDQFAGALSKMKAHKGILITTSSFSKEALGTVKDYGAKIVLIDGAQVAQLMIDYDVGVSREQVYEIKKTNSDFFEEVDI
jgi:restriction system protein